VQRALPPHEIWPRAALTQPPARPRGCAQAYQKLARLGYPIINVNSWDEITEERLEHWWKTLSPALELARWMLLVDVWGAYVQDPCPAENITKFIQRIQCAV